MEITPFRGYQQRGRPVSLYHANDNVGGMNKRGEPTRYGGDWHSPIVRIILLREVAA